MQIKTRFGGWGILGVGLKSCWDGGTLPRSIREELVWDFFSLGFWCYPGFKACFCLCNRHRLRRTELLQGHLRSCLQKKPSPMQSQVCKIVKNFPKLGPSIFPILGLLSRGFLFLIYAVKWRNLATKLEEAYISGGALLYANVSIALGWIVWFIFFPSKNKGWRRGCETDFER